MLNFSLLSSWLLAYKNIFLHKKFKLCEHILLISHRIRFHSYFFFNSSLLMQFIIDDEHKLSFQLQSQMKMFRNKIHVLFLCHLSGKTMKFSLVGITAAWYDSSQCQSLWCYRKRHSGQLIHQTTHPRTFFMGLCKWLCVHTSPVANINDSKNRTGLLLYKMMLECCHVYGERQHTISVFHTQQTVPILNVVKVYDFPPLQMVKKLHVYLVPINLYFGSNLWN
jgi:hypothetical protein